MQDFLSCFCTTTRPGVSIQTMTRFQELFYILSNLLESLQCDGIFAESLTMQEFLSCCAMSSNLSFRSQLCKTLVVKILQTWSNLSKYDQKSGGPPPLDPSIHCRSIICDNDIIEVSLGHVKTA